MKAICLYQREIGVDDVYTVCARIANEIEYSQFVEKAREISQGANRKEHSYLFWDINHSTKEWQLLEAMVNVPNTQAFIGGRKNVSG